MRKKGGIRYHVSAPHPLKLSMRSPLLSNLQQELPNFPPEFDNRTMQKLIRLAHDKLIRLAHDMLVSVN